jgi:carbon-monoxide dehydrogenase small subunit
MTPTESLFITLTVNGEAVSREVAARLSLADFLREELRLTGTHLGCEHGVCGACTVLMDNEPVRACLMLAVQARGRSVTTVEGLTPPAGGLTPLQAAFQRRHAVQCGFCTPGMLMSATALLAGNPDPTAEHVRDALSGNICRCTGYVQIVEAVMEAAAEART